MVGQFRHLPLLRQAPSGTAVMVERVGRLGGKRLIMADHGAAISARVGQVWLLTEHLEIERNTC